MAREARWEPLVTGEVAARALRTAQAVAADLRALPDEDARQWAHEIAILHAYLDHARVGTAEDAEADRRLDQAIEYVANASLTPALFGGFVGVAWSATHIEATEEFELEDIDSALVSLVERSPWEGDFDLLHGLTGLGVYAIERLPRQSAVQLLSRIVDCLDALAKRDSGTRWLTPARLLSAANQTRFPTGCYDLGIAHGVAGVIALLAMAYEADVQRERSSTLLEGAVTWLLGQKLADPRDSTFGYYAGDPGAARSAWCYGDPGIAAVLLLAGYAAERGDWKEMAVEIARHAARRSLPSSGVVDAGICHGAAGLAHMFNRMYQQTEDAELGAAARTWLQRTLDMSNAEDGIGGYVALHQRGDDLVAKRDASLLTGATGIALVLLAAATAVDPCWDRILLLSSGARR